jgi:hypothetical protein
LVSAQPSSIPLDRILRPPLGFWFPLLGPVWLVAGASSATGRSAHTLSLRDLHFAVDPSSWLIA